MKPVFNKQSYIPVCLLAFLPICWSTNNHLPPSSLSLSVFCLYLLSVCLLLLLNGMQATQTFHMYVLFTCKHADNREQNFLHRLDRAPPFCTALITHGIITRSMKNGDTHTAIWIHYNNKQTMSKLISVLEPKEIH